MSSEIREEAKGAGGVQREHEVFSPELISKVRTKDKWDCHKSVSGSENSK